MIEIIRSGFHTTVQDYPGRIGYWNVGIPPSGPMDSFSFRIANRLAGNSDNAAGLEMTLMGPKIKFLRDAMVAFSGAEMAATLNGQAIPWWQSVYVEKGSVVDIGALSGEGCRSYMAVKGGLDVPEYLGSRSTFPKGGFGGHPASPLLAEGTRIGLTPGCDRDCRNRGLPGRKIPKYTSTWLVGAVPGPHDAPDFFTRDTMDMFYGTAWRVHHNSNRLGYRLEGPVPVFARPDGGEGGRHPSNLIDYPYAVGTVNVSGNLPVILTVDGPSLGGFISIATIPTADLWKVGQAKPHDHIRFEKITPDAAVNRLVSEERFLDDIKI